MLLIFRHDRIDIRQLPYLMPNRLGIDARQILATLSTLRGNTRNDILTLIRGNEWTFVFIVTGLTAAFAFGFAIGVRRLVVWMGGRWRLRRVIGSDVGISFEFRESSGQLGDLGVQLADLLGLPTNERAHIGGQSGQQFVRE